jgi:hypothetical protein
MIIMDLEYELTEAPAETVASFYKQEGTKWVLQVKGAVPQTKFAEVEGKVSEFRTNNIALKKQIEDLSKAAPNAGDIEKIVETRVSEMKTNYETQLTALAQEKTQLSTNLERVVLSDAVKTAATEYGVLPSALPDVLARAKEMFVVQDGVAVPKDKKVDKDGKTFTVNSWITSLTESAGHLFAQSRGSGSFKPTRGSPTPQKLSPAEKIAAGLASRNK